MEDSGAVGGILGLSELLARGAMRRHGLCDAMEWPVRRSDLLPGLVFYRSNDYL
jgi:hypothetical protein